MLLSRHIESLKTKLYLRVELEEIHRGWTTPNYYFCVSLGQVCSVFIIFTADRDSFVSAQFTHMPEMCLSGIVYLGIVSSELEMIMDKNDEYTFYFESSLILQSACCDLEALRARTSL